MNIATVSVSVQPPMAVGLASVLEDGGCWVVVVVVVVVSPSAVLLQLCLDLGCTSTGVMRC